MNDWRSVCTPCARPYARCGFVVASLKNHRNQSRSWKHGSRYGPRATLPDSRAPSCRNRPSTTSAVRLNRSPPAPGNDNACPTPSRLGVRHSEPLHRELLRADPAPHAPGTRATSCSEIEPRARPSRSPATPGPPTSTSYRSASRPSAPQQLASCTADRTSEKPSRCRRSCVFTGAGSRGQKGEGEG